MEQNGQNYHKMAKIKEIADKIFGGRVKLLYFCADFLYEKAHFNSRGEQKV